MQTHEDFDFKRPLIDPTIEQPLYGPLAPSHQGRQWSYTTLKAARPTPDKMRRSYAFEWNQQFPEGHELRVDPARFPLEIPERSPEEIEVSWKRLEKLSGYTPD